MRLVFALSLLAALASLAACSSSTPPPVDAALDACQYSGPEACICSTGGPGMTEPGCIGTPVVCNCNVVDGGTDGGRDTGNAPDVVVVEDVAAVDVLDVPPVDVVADVLVDAGADVAVDALDAPAPTDVADSTAPDASPPCSDNTFRCGTGVMLERCTSGTWSLYNFCNNLTSSTRETCGESACVLCAIPDGGTGCGTICATDGECHDQGRARCVGGRCARRGWVRCTMNTDCVGFSQGTSLTACSDGPTIDGAVIRVCSGMRSERCTSDAMCPRDYACNTATGFCAR